MYNIHQFLTDGERDALITHLTRLQPGVVVVMDDPSLARQIHAAAPTTRVVYRKYFPGGGDDHAHTKITPQQWFDTYVSDLHPSEGIFYYAGNEPGFSPELVIWLTEIAQLVLADGQAKAVLGNWSVGTPEPADWQQARELLNLCGDNPSRLMIGLHEYAPTLVGYQFGLGPNPANWPDKIDGLPWLLGRYRHLLAACDQMQIRRPKIAITEWGFDRIHAVGDWQQALPKTDGCDIVGPLWCNLAAWEQKQPSGYDWPRYMVTHLSWAWRAIYRHDPEIAGVALFCWGAQGGAAWEDFDYKRVPGIFALIEAADWRMVDPPETNTTWRVEV